jgi:hypothetical protein
MLTLGTRPLAASLQGDERYGVGARLLHKYLDLAYLKGQCHPSTGWLAKALGSTKRTVLRNNVILTEAKLIAIDPQGGRNGTNAIAPLPRGDHKAAYREQLFAALGCCRLDLNYRAIWLLRQLAYRGRPVNGYSRDDLGHILDVEDCRNVWAALRKNVARGYIKDDTSGDGRINTYRLTSQAVPDDGEVGNMTIDEDGDVVHPPQFTQDDLREFFSRKLRQPRRS